MEVSGLIRTTLPPDRLVSALGDARTLARLLPDGSKLDQIAEGRFSFSVTKAVGPIKLTLPGQMTLTPKGKGHDQTLTARASHLIGGKVDLDLDLTIEHHGGHTRLAYSGELVATGLAGRVLREHRARANSALKAALTRLKMHAEGQMRQSNAQA